MLIRVDYYLSFNIFVSEDCVVVNIVVVTCLIVTVVLYNSMTNVKSLFVNRDREHWMILSHEDRSQWDTQSCKWFVLSITFKSFIKL